MLSRVKISNFRSILQAEIDDAGPIVALVGRNGSGKSNILQSIFRTASMASGINPVGFLEPPHVERDGFSMLLEFSVKEICYRYQFKVSFSKELAPTPMRVSESLDFTDTKLASWVSIVNRDGGKLSISERDAPLAIGENSPALPAVVALLPAEDEAVVRIRPALSFLSAVRYYPLDEPTISDGRNSGPILGSTFEAWKAAVDSGAAFQDSVLYRIIYLWKERRDELDALTEMLGANGLGLVDSITVNLLNAATPPNRPPGPDSLYYFITFAPMRGAIDRTVQVTYEGLSSGTRRLIRIITSIIFDKSSVMLVEQPEDSLNQGMTTKAFGLIRQNVVPAQLVFSSHSSALLNKLNPEEIRLVTLHDGYTVVRKLTSEEKNAAVNYMNREGPLFDFLEMVQED